MFIRDAAGSRQTFPASGTINNVEYTEKITKKITKKKVLLGLPVPFSHFSDNENLPYFNMVFKTTFAFAGSSRKHHPNRTRAFSFDILVNQTLLECFAGMTSLLLSYINKMVGNVWYSISIAHTHRDSPIWVVLLLLLFTNETNKVKSCPRLQSDSSRNAR